MNTLTNPDSQKTSDHWNSKSGPSFNWWSNEIVCRHINKIVCGKSIPGLSRGIINLAVNKAKDLNVTYNKGLSIGCGSGVKELYLLSTGIVKYMTCYDLAINRLAQGQKRADELGLSDRIEFIAGDVLSEFSFYDTKGEHDLVYWNNSLHHMPNTSLAVEWSRIALSNGGMLIVDEYIGPNYIQFTDEMLSFANRIRNLLPPQKLLYPGEVSGTEISSRQILKRPDLKRLIAKDPSEAVDSESIIPALAKFFPSIDIRLTGGAVYFCALPPLYCNFDMNDINDRNLMSMLMLLDEMHLESHPASSLYAAALAMVY